MVLHDGQAEARVTAFVARGIGAMREETVEDARHVGVGDARPHVGDARHDLALLGLHLATTVTITVDPGGEKLSALSSRFSKTCVSRSSVASTSERSRPGVELKAHALALSQSKSVDDLREQRAEIDFHGLLASPGGRRWS